MPKRPELDPQLSDLLAGMPDFPRLDRETLEQIRPYAAGPIEPILEGRAVDRREITIPGPDGTDLPLTIVSPPDATTAPCIYWIHGGGMVMGNRYSQIDIPLEWLDQLGAVVVSVDYRLAPEASGTDLVDDCYQGLLWVAAHAAELGVDPSRIVVAGASAGGGLAAGVALRARDEHGPALAAQVLIGPMLDYRNATTSSRQFSGEPGVWTREMNAFGWQSVLAGLPGKSVPAYVSPATATDLAGLPPAYIDAGSAEVFRDEVVTYAFRIWSVGGHADLHIWAGGFHGFDALFPAAPLSESARETRTDWLARRLTKD
ncbi:alpha/beta hydrolase [Actinoplanes sp. TRM 88003]|uniref:Alpha/beta hydrolase n=1 Tax=Paractinoplanes aksuensis TaxID=2939490 RepID=A0ABT1DEV7_9ACTN|nr:alpha/beta hydrolase [Actinoplanes aksuensis]MCO8269345.1 alpha/beta hydrolase [Actinoplanes aksuensis]